MKIGILTGGGDAPGLNGILESASRVLLNAGYSLVGINDGFEGIFESRTRTLQFKDIDNIHAEAGTLLGTSNRCGTKGREAEFLTKYRELGLDGLLVAGGDGTFAGLKAFAEIPIVGVPKTIDNDISGTEITFGYDTACTVVAESVDSLRATANAHRRIIVVETMGRTTGWIALGGGMASYADVVLMPERPFDRKKLVEFIRAKQFKGYRGLMIVAAEGAKANHEEAKVAFNVAGSPQAERYGGFAWELARWLEKEISWEARHVVLGHLQRSRTPTATDRFLTLAMGVEAGRMILENDWGKCTVYRDGKVQRAPLQDLMGPARLVPPEHRWVKMLESLGSFV